MIVPHSQTDTHEAYSTGQHLAGESHAALRMEEHHGYAGLVAIEANWLKLIEGQSACSLYQHPAWFRAHYEGLGELAQSAAQSAAHSPDESPVDADITFFSVYRDNLLVAIFPIQWRRRSGLLRHAGMPHAQGMSRADCCVAEHEDKPMLWQHVWQQIATKNWDVFVIAGDGITSDAHIFECLNTAQLARRQISANGLRCGLLDVKPYEEILAGLKKKFRSNLRRSHTQLNKLGEASFDVYQEGQSLTDAFDAFVALEMSGWKGASTVQKDGYNAGAAIGNYDWKYRFYLSLVTQLGARGCAEICLLTVEDRVIGGQISFMMGNTYYIMKTAYDEQARSVSAGHLMIANTLQRCHDKDIGLINLISDYEWVRTWNPRYEPYYRIDQFSPTLRGHIGWLRHRLRGGVPERKS